MLNTIFDTIKDIAMASGFVNVDIPSLIMIIIALFLSYLAIAKGYEPLLLLPIAFGMLLTNIPNTGLFHMDY